MKKKKNRKPILELQNATPAEKAQEITHKKIFLATDPRPTNRRATTEEIRRFCAQNALSVCKALLCTTTRNCPYEKKTTGKQKINLKIIQFF
jgi:hypothetical protein